MQNALKPPAGKMITDFPTAPLAPGLTGAGGDTVEKSFYASHTEILTLPVVVLLKSRRPIFDIPFGSRHDAVMNKLFLQLR